MRTTSITIISTAAAPRHSPRCWRSSSGPIYERPKYGPLAGDPDIRKPDRNMAPKKKRLRTETCPELSAVRSGRSVEHDLGQVRLAAGVAVDLVVLVGGQRAARDRHAGGVAGDDRVADARGSATDRDAGLVVRRGDRLHHQVDVVRETVGGDADGIVAHGGNILENDALISRRVAIRDEAIAVVFQLHVLDRGRGNSASRRRNL